MQKPSGNYELQVRPLIRVNIDMGIVASYNSQPIFHSVSLFTAHC